MIIDEKCRWFSVERDKTSDLFGVTRKKRGLDHNLWVIMVKIVMGDLPVEIVNVKIFVLISEELFALLKMNLFRLLAHLN